MTAGYVYDVYDAQGRLIYVGSTRNVFVRMRQHVVDSWWIDQAVKVRATVHPSIEAARLVEKERIYDQHPRWNISGLPDSWSWTAEQYRDYAIARANAGALLTAFTSSHLRRLAKEYLYRFGTEMPTAERTAA